MELNPLKWFKKPQSNKKDVKAVKEEAVKSIQNVSDAIAQKINSSYRARRNFNGEKLDGGMNYDTAYQLDYESLRLKSMRAYMDSMQGRAIIKRLSDTVINTGLSLESTPSTILGLSKEERKEITNKIESKYNLWADSKDCDLSRENNLGQIEGIEFRNQLVKGDYFGALIFSEDNSLINPLQVKIIKPELVSTPFDSKQKKVAEAKGNRIIDGIELNDQDQEIAYYIRTRKSGSFNHEHIRLTKYGNVSGRQQVIHGKIQDFGSEVRGVPILSHVAHELEKITDYSLLELMAAVANATVAAIVTPGEDNPATNPFPGNTFVPPSLASNDDVTTTSLNDRYTNLGDNRLNNAGGLLISSLNAGEKYESFDTKRPNVNFDGFVDSITKYLAASLSIPIEILHMKFGENFSASRASLKLFWQSLEVWRSDFISDFLTPVYNSFLLGEVGTGNLILKGFEDPTLRAAWQSAKWIGIPSPSIDPFKEERAAQIRVKEGFTTREHESQRRHRTSFDSNVDRLGTENQRLAKANEPLQEKAVA